MQNSHSLTDGPITRTLLQFAFPILWMNVVQALSGSVSAFWVGRHLGEAALSAVSNAQSMMFLLTGVAVGVAMAATILVGQYMGASKISEAKRVVSMGASVFLALSIAMSIVGIVFAQPLLLTMGTSGEALSLAVPYTRILFLALPPAYLNLFVICVMLGTGDSKTPLGSMILRVVLGTALHPLLMFGAGPIPGMGIVGAAAAAVVAQTASLAALIGLLYHQRYLLCLYRNDLAITSADWGIVGTLLRKGSPMGAQVLVVSLSAVLMIVLVNRFGVDTTAAYGASIQLWSYIQLPAVAIAMAVSAMSAQCAGAQNWGRVREAARVGVVSCAVITGLIVLLVYVADDYAYRLFLPENSPALSIAGQINNIVMWSFVFLVIATVLFGVMRAAGVVMVPLFIHSVSLLCVRFPLAALMMDRWQADAIWWSFSISSMVDFVLAGLYYRYGGWQSAGRVDVVTALGTHNVQLLERPLQVEEEPALDE